MKNKKLYIFMTTLIRGVGGGHNYTLCKIESLQASGYDTLFLHANDPASKIYIEGLLKYERNYDNHLFFPSFFFSQRTQLKVIEGLVNKYIPSYNSYDSIIIESSTTTCSTWAELLAERIKAKHLVFLLDEHPQISNETMFNFYDFKLRRRELVGIGKDSIRIMFKEWKNIEVSPFLLAYNKKPLEDVPYDITKINKADYIIGSIGRLEKSFLIPALEVVKRFASNHTDKSFTVILIGGSIGNDKAERKIKRLFKKVPNVSVYITGIIYPMPVSLVSLPQVYLSTSGGCKASQELGKVTISFDIKDGLPIGVLGYTTNNHVYRGKNERVPDLYKLLDEVLIEKKYADTEVLYNSTDQGISYKLHFDYLNSSEQEKAYYHLVAKGLSKGQKIMSALIRIIGTNSTKYIVKYLYPIIQKYS